MESKILNWYKWVHKYFYKGKTPAIYLLFFLFSFSIYELILNRINLNSFILLLIMVITSYGVFTDLVAHLWWDGLRIDISLKSFIHKIFHFRWHDGYGIIIFFISFVLSESIIHYNPILVAVVSFSIGIILLELTLTRFYH